MGEKTRETLKLQFDKRLRLEFSGARITSDAGLLACRELDGVLGLAKMAPTYLQEPRGGRNVQHELVPQLRQSGEKDRGSIAFFRVESLSSADRRGFWGLWCTACMSRTTAAPRERLTTRYHGYIIGDKGDEGAGYLIAS